MSLLWLVIEASDVYSTGARTSCPLWWVLPAPRTPLTEATVVILHNRIQGLVLRTTSTPSILPKQWPQGGAVPFPVQEEACPLLRPACCQQDAAAAEWGWQSLALLFAEAPGGRPA